MGVGLHRLWTMAAVLLAGSSAARGQAPAALSWVREPGAESCIAAPELGARVERLVGPVLVAAPSAEVSVEGTIARRGRAFAARVVISDARGVVLGQRDVQGADVPAGAEPDCRALDDQLAFVIAVAIDPNAALAELPGELAPEGDPGAELLAELEAEPTQPAGPRSAASSRPVVTSRVREEPRQAPWHAAFAAGTGLRAGALPAVNGTFQLEASAGRAWFTQRASFALSLPQTVAEREARIELAWLELGASSCAALAPVAAPGLELCAGLAVARLSATASRLTAQDDRARWLVGPRAAGRAAVEIGAGVRLVLEAAVLSFWPKHSIGYEAAGTFQVVHRVPDASFSGAVMIEVIALP